MCGRFYLTTDAQTLSEHFKAPATAPALLLVPASMQASGNLDLTPRYNIAPSQAIPAIRQGETGRELVMLRWGLIPFWAKDKKIGYKMINARAETVASKPAYRAAFRRRRALLPASGFYEWQPVDGGKQPYSIRTNGDLFAFAGLWEYWKGEGGEPIESCTIIVTEANDKLKTIHDRMPVILDPEDYATWLDPEIQDPKRLEPLLRSYPGDRMNCYPVSHKVNNPRVDGPECIEPVLTE